MFCLLNGTEMSGDEVVGGKREENGKIKEKN